MAGGVALVAALCWPGVVGTERPSAQLLAFPPEEPPGIECDEDGDDGDDD